ncbi:hypothetical protein SKAU_G00025250 [Synaphobranchus kaupii]|uniref:UPAR/Ly6 domain-containing protein n=1 Tax=Synaphobranchus kaupii TaxID=118154 RepID=A0A9Q1JEW1_SYNKA|nr:hypothetical protein SKAU_G00025250 [Synaphobranchus kaupii]
MDSFSPPRAVSVVLCVCLFLPALHCENLLCYYCPLLPKSKACRLVLAECPPQELCFTASGRYGGRIALSARGCMSEQDCRLEHTILYKGSNFTMSYSCCDWHYCNSGSHSSVYSATIALAAAAAIILPARLS